MNVIDGTARDPAPAPLPPERIEAAYAALKESRPGLRAREAAGLIGISEAEFVAARCGVGVQRLRTDWASLLRGLLPLGVVMALTRNEDAVHEVTGRIERIEVAGGDAALTGDGLELRLGLTGWRFGYAVEEGGADHPRRSLQFFDGAGTALHKVYAVAGTHAQAWLRLLNEHAAPNQEAGEQCIPGSAAPGAAPPPPALRSGRCLDGARFVEALEGLARDDATSGVVVSSPGATQAYIGRVSRLKRTGARFNVLDPSFNLHLRDGAIATVWSDIKPTPVGALRVLDARDIGGMSIATIVTGFESADLAGPGGLLAALRLGAP